RRPAARRADPRLSDSLLSQYQINDPAAADVLAGLPAMVEDVAVSAAGVFQRVGQDRHAVEGAFLVDRRGETGEIAGLPGGIDDHGAEGVAEDITDQVTVLGRR